MNNIQIHPFDLTYDQIHHHKKVYKYPKGALSNSFPIASATLDQVFVSLQKQIQLRPDTWRNILKHLDQSTFDINFSQENFEQKYNNALEVKQFRLHAQASSNYTQLNKQDLVLLASKIQFSDFLKAVQRESVLRDILAEHQMYFHSTKRLFYQQDLKLVNRQALEAMLLAKQSGYQAKASIPQVTYLIENLVMFQFQGVHLVLVCFENQSVQVYECSNGHYTYEFTFYDYLFELSKNANAKLTEKERQDQKNILEQEFNKSGLTKAEFSMMKRKTLREKGEFVPELPPYTAVERTHFHQLNSKANEEKFKKRQEMHQSGAKQKANDQLQNYLSFVSKEETVQNQTILEEEQAGESDNEQPHGRVGNKGVVQAQKTKLQDQGNQERGQSAEYLSRAQINQKRLISKASQSQPKHTTPNLVPKKVTDSMANLTTTAGGATSQKLKELKMKQMRREAKSPINFNSKASVVDFKSANKDMKKSQSNINGWNQHLEDKANKIWSRVQDKNQQQSDLGENVSEKKLLEDEIESLKIKSPKKTQAQSSVVKFKKMLSREDYNLLRKQETLMISQQHREEVKRKAQKQTGNPNSSLCGFFGIESIMPRDEQLGNTDGKGMSLFNYIRSISKPAYGLSPALFEEKEREEINKNEFSDKTEIKQKENEAMIHRLKLEQPLKERPWETKDGNSKALDSKKKMQEVLDKNQKLERKIAELEEKEEFFAKILNELNDQQKVSISKIKSKRNDVEVRKSIVKKKDDFELENVSKKSPRIAKIQENMKKQREERLEKFNQQNEPGGKNEAGKIKKKSDKKQTYPICMEYYEPYNIAIFGLVSKEIQIHQLKQTGVRRTFQHLQSMRVEHMIVSMTVERHKGSSNLIVCLGTQSKKKDKSEVVVFILDPKLEFEIVYSYRWMWPYTGPNEVSNHSEQQITQVYYKDGCGLIICSFTGFIEIYDAIHVNHSVWDNGKLNLKSGGGSISTVCYSEGLDIIAYAGVSGKIYVLDQTTKNSNGQIQAHKGEVIMLRFFDQQNQLISISTNGEVGLWDAQKLSKIQLLRNSTVMSQKIISSCTFYEPLGRVLMATTSIFNYDLQVDIQVQIKQDQLNTIARDYLRQFMNQLIQSNFITEEHIERIKHIKNGENLTDQEYIADAYRNESLKNCLPGGKEYNGSVLASKNSKLVGIVIDQVQFHLYAIDSDLMIRLWDISTNTSIRSYMIETRDDQIMEANQNDTQIENLEKKKAQLARADNDIKFLLVAFEAGEIQVNNLFTGALIYNNANVPAIKIENEITQMKFFNTQTQFWIAASCWEGKVAFLKRPQVSQGRNYLKFQKCKSSHQRDVITLDINKENNLATGSMDNVICFWNSFNGVESKKVKLPNEIANIEKGQNIQYIRYPFKDIKDILLIVINNGDCFILETQSEKFMEFDNDCYQLELENSSNQSSNLEDEDNTESKNNYSNKYLMGRVCPFPVLDLSNEFLVTCQENGKGMIHQLKFNSAHKDNSGDINPISFVELNKFKVSSKIDIARNPVCILQIAIEHEIFVVGQYRGNVTVFNLLTGEALGMFNEGVHDRPKHIFDQELPEIDPKTGERQNKLVRALKKSKAINDYVKYQTKPKPWHPKLIESQQPQMKLRSRILDSVSHQYGVNKNSAPQPQLTKLGTQNFKMPSKEITNFSSRPNLVDQSAYFSNVELVQKDQYQTLEVTKNMNSNRQGTTIGGSTYDKTTLTK